MKVKATYVFEFEPDTSDINPEFSGLKDIAKEMTKTELAYMLKHSEITTKDFDFEVINDYWEK